jgi:hypothetical protein
MQSGPALGVALVDGPEPNIAANHCLHVLKIAFLGRGLQMYEELE